MAISQPLYSQLYDALAERIRSGDWEEGKQLPSEKALVAEFGTSRGPVRQALAKLRTEGLIVGGRGAPPRVQRAVRSQSFDTFISFTEWVEEDLGRTPGAKVIELSRRLADERLARDLGVPLESPVVAVVRLRLIDDEPVMFERSVYVMDAGQHLLVADLEAESIYQILRNHGFFPTRAHNVIDAVSAGDIEAHWLDVEPGSPLLRVRRTTLDQHGAILDIADNRYLPNKATFAVDNTRLNPTPLTRITVDSPSIG